MQKIKDHLNFEQPVSDDFAQFLKFIIYFRNIKNRGLSKFDE